MMIDTKSFKFDCARAKQILTKSPEKLYMSRHSSQPINFMSLLLTANIYSLFNSLDKHKQPKSLPKLATPFIKEDHVHIRSIFNYLNCFIYP